MSSFFCEAPAAAAESILYDNSLTVRHHISPETIRSVPMNDLFLYYTLS